MRDGQHCSIVKCLLEASGCWKRVDIKSNFYIEKVHTAEVPWLERIGEQFYINLWPENIFGLAVDGDLCEVPHICAWNAVLIESMFYPFPDHNTAFPRLLCDSGTGPGTRFTPKNPDQSPPPICPHRTPVYIPTIPRYIDACLSRHLLLALLPDAPWFLGESDLDISYLIWYLFLEHGAQWEKLLLKLHRQRREVMKDILDHYKRTVKGNINMWRDSKGMLTSRPPKARIDDTNWRNRRVDLYFFEGKGWVFLQRYTPAFVERSSSINACSTHVQLICIHLGYCKCFQVLVVLLMLPSGFKYTCGHAMFSDSTYCCDIMNRQN